MLTIHVQISIQPLEIKKKGHINNKLLHWYVSNTTFVISFWNKIKQFCDVITPGPAFLCSTRTN